MKRNIISYNLPLYKLPFKIKLWWAKQMMKMFRGFGETYPNDIVLYTRIQSMVEELDLWIKTDGRPTTSNVNYQINKIKSNE